MISSNVTTSHNYTINVDMKYYGPEQKKIFNVYKLLNVYYCAGNGRTNLQGNFVNLFDVNDDEKRSLKLFNYLVPV